MLIFQLVILLYTATAKAVDTLVELDYAKYDGVANDTGVTHWWGMRFAAPPVGNLRFAAPQDPEDEGDDIISADEHGLICRSTPGPAESNTTDEDCLFLDVYAPSDATTDNLLPVYFYISGGGFNSISDANLNGTGLIQASNHSIVIVTFNYRVGIFGFLASQEVNTSTTATVNAGLYDQRKALEWVQKYIHLFGGDPNHVTIGGASAGAASVFYHLTAYNGRNDSLFHAAAAESQSFATMLTIEASQYQYDNIINKVNCTDATDTLSCLRNVSAADIQRVNQNIPFPGQSDAPAYMWNVVVDNDLAPDYTYRLFEQGKFLKMPVIFGDDTNGGTVFVPKNTTTLADQNAYLSAQFPFINSSQLTELDSDYPNPNATCPNTGCLWRKTSNIYGDLRYMCPGLYISRQYAKLSNYPSYNYLYNISDPDQIAEGLGVPHTTERSVIWGYDYPDSFAPEKENAWAVEVVMGYWVRFIQGFRPGVAVDVGEGGEGVEWEIWGGEDEEGGWGRRMVFEGRETTGMRSVGEEYKGWCERAWGWGAGLRQ